VVWDAATIGLRSSRVSALSGFPACANAIAGPISSAETVVALPFPASHPTGVADPLTVWPILTRVQAGGASRLPYGRDFLVLTQFLAVREGQRAEGLILCRGSRVFLCCQAECVNYNRINLWANKGSSVWFFEQESSTAPIASLLDSAPPNALWLKLLILHNQR